MATESRDVSPVLHRLAECHQIMAELLEENERSDIPMERRLAIHLEFGQAEALAQQIQGVLTVAFTLCPERYTLGGSSDGGEE